MKKEKFYVVWSGFSPGIYSTWEECECQVRGFEGARFKSYSTYEEAIAAFNQGAEASIIAKSKSRLIAPVVKGGPQMPCLCVDAACSGNPGPMEYRGVEMPGNVEVFRMGPYEEGTNNIGEFLAIIHALALMKKKKITLPIYSDSLIAMNWIRGGKAKTNLKRSNKNASLFTLLERGEFWLAENGITAPIYKWKTESWGEIPADFGRK